MQINDYFCSKEFKEILLPLKEEFDEKYEDINVDIIGDIIDISLKYYIIFSHNNKIDVSKLNKFLKELMKKLINDEKVNFYALDNNICARNHILDLFVKELLDELELPKECLSDETIKSNLFNYIIQKILGNTYKFHSFNSVFYDSIKNHGINPNISFTSQSNLNKIDDIFMKYGCDGVLGYHQVECINQISYAEIPCTAYRYGVASPEWFSFFINALSRSQYKGNSKRHKYEDEVDSLITSNYNHAKQNLVMLMLRLKFNPIDKNIVLNFFEENWAKYANNFAYVSITKEKRDKEELEELKKNILNSTVVSVNSIQDIIESCFDRLDNDIQTKETIKTKNSLFIKLPKYDDLIKYIYQYENINNKKRTFQKY